MSEAEKELSQEEKLAMVRHSAAHVMAEAVLKLFPEAKFGIGPSIENGFYYDFELPRALTPEDLPVIEDEMKQIIKGNLPFEKCDISKQEARRLFANQPYKLELIDDIENETVSIYRQGNFTDLCRGPHMRFTKQIKAFKLLSIAGAYWKGSEKNPMLQRIYGTAFDTKDGLKEYLEKLEEAARRDHRKLGKELDLYSISNEAGPGLALWHPNGATVRRVIEDFWRSEHIKRGYEIVYSPHIAKVDLWKTSGHWEFYRDSMYSPMDIDGEEYVVKPMNCVFHILMYKSQLRSYRDLPLRWAELGTVYRYERSGVLHGLSRVRGFTQDDAHIFCRFDQLENEVANALDLAMFMVKTFGFEKYKIMLSTRPEKYTGTLEAWESATNLLKKALEREGVNYEIDPGEGVFYGPKIDIKFSDAIGRDWQGPTIQVDFNLPQRFDVTYIDNEGKEQPIAMVHRTVLGSMERFMASILEHYGGAFPIWLAPLQVSVLPIADRHIEYAEEIAKILKAKFIRTELDDRSERINQKIRQAQLKKVPCMIIIGDKEVSEKNISVRLRDGKQINGVTFDDFFSKLSEAINKKARDFQLG